MSGVRVSHHPPYQPVQTGQVPVKREDALLRFVRSVGTRRAFGMLLHVLIGSTYICASISRARWRIVHGDTTVFKPIGNHIYQLKSSIHVNRRCWMRRINSRHETPAGPATNFFGAVALALPRHSLLSALIMRLLLLTEKQRVLHAALRMLN